ncbi:MAG: hypothetical protein RR555_03760 [Bacteroidales bacterium]
MKKLIFFVFAITVVFLVITSFKQKAVLSTSDLLSANLAALSSTLFCQCSADCPMGSECFENKCTDIDASGRAICYVQIADIPGSKCLACVTCLWENGIGTQKGGFCKW